MANNLYTPHLRSVLKRSFFNCGTLLYKNAGVEMCVVTALLCLSVSHIEARWSSAEVITTGFIGVTCIVGIVCVLINKRRIYFGAIDLFVALWALYFCWSTYRSDFPCSTTFLKGIWPCLLYFSLKPVFATGRLKEEALLALFVVFGCYEALCGYCQLFTGSRHYLYAVTGSFQNPGPYSAYLMTALVVAVTGLKTRIFTQSKQIVIACAVIIGIIFPATLSRAAILAFVVIMLWTFRDWCWRRRYLIASVLLALVVIAYFYKRGSADGRVLLWQCALSEWTNATWLGTGTGSFMHSFSQGIASLYNSGTMETSRFQSVDVPEYAFNDAIYILVEHGMIGLSLWVGIVCAVCHALWHKSKPLAYALLSLLVFSMFSYPMELMPFKAIFIIIMARSATKRSTASFSLRHKTGMVSLCIVLMVAGVLTTHRAHQTYETDLLINDLKTAPQPTLLKDYYAYLENETDDANYLFCFGKTLSALGRYNDSNAIMRRGPLISADPMFYVIMGNNYQGMALPSQAEWCYQRAFAMMPNRLYPLYKLALLYHDTNQTAKMKRMCQRIICFQPKIESKATSDMKAKAKRLLLS